MVASSLLQMVRKSIHNPERAALRLVLKARVSRTTARRDRQRLLRAISRVWNVDAWLLLREYHKSGFARWYQDQLGELLSLAGQSRMGTSSNFHLEALYVLVRAARPQTIVETGVLYGASSAHILAALAANGHGRLCSIDLGNDPGEPPHDFLVPPQFRTRWEYISGHAKQELPRLLARLGRVDMFHHDSLHTFEHMMWEYTTVAPHLAPDGILASHDVFVSDSIRTIFRQNAFPAFCRQKALRHLMVRNSGIALRPKAARARAVRTSRPSLERPALGHL